MHTGEKPFQCKICQKSINQTEVLSRHVATHRAHSCDKWEKSFQHGIELENHKQQHSGIFCKSCGKYYKVQNDLKKHQAKFYQPKSPCYLCDKSFSKTSDLLRHTARHKRYSCDQCEKSFKLESINKSIWDWSVTTVGNISKLRMFWNNIKPSTQEKSCSNAKYVTNNSPRVELFLGMKRVTRRSLVVSAQNLLNLKWR